MPIIDNCSEPVLTSCELKTMVCDEVVLTATNDSISQEYCSLH